MTEHREGCAWLVDRAPCECAALSQSATGPTVVALSDVQAEHVEWLWPGRLPLGKLVMLDGDPSMGKSTLALDIAARLSTGKPWPDGAPGSIGATLLLSAEDGLADTIRPRLEAAEADVRNVHALTEIKEYDGNGALHTRSVSLADIALISQVIAERRIKLVIIDVLMAYLGRSVDSHKDQDIRTVLHQLAALAERHRCCMLLLRHLNKAGAGSPMYRGGGSIGIIGAARAGYLVAPDPEDQTRRVLACIKNNLAPEPEALTYRLVSAGDVARVQWEGTSAHTAHDLLSLHGDDDEHTERDEAADWLKGYLIEHGGQSPAGDVLKAGRAVGYAQHTLQRARRRAGVTTGKASFGSGWVWELAPEDDTKMT